jgi:hypothetical protein
MIKTAIAASTLIIVGLPAAAFFRNDSLRVDWTRRDFTGDNAGEADVWSASYVRRF